MKQAALTQTPILTDGGYIHLTLAFKVEGRWRYVHTTTN